MEILKFLENKPQYSGKVLLGVGTFLGILLIRKIFNRPRTYLTPNVRDKVIIFTGSSDGIGKEAALQLVKDGAIVIFACRNKTKTEEAINTLTDEKLKKNAIFMELDLSKFDSIRNFVTEFKSKYQTLDILINNAASINKNFELTSDNIEMTLQTNTFSPMILTQLLSDQIKSCNGKVINLTGKAFYLWNKKKDFYYNINHEEYDFEKKNYSPIYQYCYSKLGNVFFTQYLHKNLMRAVVVHPGVIKTSLNRDLNGFFWNFVHFITLPIRNLFCKTIYMGSQTILHLCYAENSDFKSGEYYEDNKIQVLSEWVRKEENMDAFIDFSRRVINYHGTKKGINFV